MKEKYYPPKFSESNFHCPNCGVYSQQYWYKAYYEEYAMEEIDSIYFCFCHHCKKYSVWVYEKMVYPDLSGVALPNPDLPEEVQIDYIEASTILNKSPRGASALLRLAIQKLCINFGLKGKSINDDIGELVKRGLSPKVQMALDYVRVIGNNAVHPGQIDIKDNLEVAQNLFELINIIGDVLITQPNEIDKLYNSLPEGQRNSIKRRDSKKS